MGITSSTESTTGRQQQQKQRQQRQVDDVKHLGERCPFGDSELHHMYESYNKLLHTLKLKKKNQKKKKQNEENSLGDEEPKNSHSSPQEQDDHEKDPSISSPSPSPPPPPPPSFLSDLGVHSYSVALEHSNARRNRRTKNQTTQAQAQPSPTLLVDPNTAKQQAEAKQQQLQDKVEERRLMIQVMEKRILTPEFGTKLYKQCFVSPNNNHSNTDRSAYDDDDHVDETESDGIAVTNDFNNDDGGDGDEFTRRSKLETFFDGLSNTTRRGPKPALKCLIKCCTDARKSNTDNHIGGTNSSTNPPSSSTNDFAYSSTYGNGNLNNNNNFMYGGGGGGATNTDGPKLIDTIEFVTLGYRVGLASSFMKTVCMNELRRLDVPGRGPGEGRNSEEANDDNNNNNEEEEYDGDEDPTLFFPSAAATGTATEAAIRSFAQSLGMVATKRKQRTGLIVGPGQEPSTIVEEDDIHEWAEYVAPMFALALPSLMHWIVFPTSKIPSERTIFEYPILLQESSIFRSPTTPSLFTFGCLSPALGGEYYRLYTSASDGLSFNRLQNSLLGYGGPTLIVIHSTDGSTFGAFTASAWKESKDFYGNHDCFLFQLSPQTAVYRPSGSGNNFMYCNSFARSRGYDKQAHGIGFGGSVDQPRLFLAESFDNCFARSDDLTFEKGPLLGTTTTSAFEIDTLEVWGVGGSAVVADSLKARKQQREYRQATIQKARKVDKAAFLDDLRSGLIESKAFAHRDQIRGRQGVAPVDEDEVFNRIKPTNDS